jgi:hypothetical protein
MKKSLNVFLMVSMFMLSVAPALAGVDNGTNISTGFTRDAGGGAAPIVKAKWEMDIERGQDGKYLGTDALPDAGAQFMPSGQYKVDKKITVCAIVTDPDGVADINQVYADVFYPQEIWLGPNHEANRQGCGQLMNELSLAKLTKADGIDLVCNKIKNSNNNLPTWNSGYTYAEVCALDGELWKETAYVYCGEKTLSYEDPAGKYKTLVLAQDKAGMDGTLTNQFEYLPLTAFETDFTSVSYGNVKLNTHKIVNGDLTWGVGTLPSVRNVGTTRLSMKVWQNDMGLGMTDGKWNVRYDGRVGSDAAFVEYNPEVSTKYAEPLNLSELDEMDFSILVYKFPPTHDGNSYIGNMVLSAVAEPHLMCQSTQPSEE